MARLWCNDICFENISAILFDKDGTLADSHAFLKELASVRSRLLEQRIPGTGAQLMAAFGCLAEAYDPSGLMAVGTRYENEVAAATYVAATGKPWADALSIAKDVFVESDRHFTRKAKFTPPFPEIATLLHHFHTAGLKLAVLSGDTTANIRDFLACYELDSVIAWCAGSEEPPTKPDPSMLQEACEQIGVAPSESLVVGDSALDYQLAQQGQAQGFVSVTWGGGPAIAAAAAIVSHPSQMCADPEHSHKHP
ncbi:MAG: HAD-IA family hydrolase [Cyanobacteria bacterium J06626_18]